MAVNYGGPKGGNMEKVVVSITLIIGLCFAFAEGPSGPGVVNFFGAVGFFCACIWIGSMITARSGQNDM